MMMGTYVSWLVQTDLIKDLVIFICYGVHEDVVIKIRPENYVNK